MKRLALFLLLFGLAVPLAGCIVEEPGRGGEGGGGCFWHPGRCR